MSQSPSGAVRVLAVFATEEDRRSLSQLFRDFRWKVQFIDNSSTLEDAWRDFRPDVVLTDSMLPAGECWKDVLRSAQERSGELPVIVTSRLADERLWAEVLNLGGYDLLVKPFVATEVQNVVCMACRAHHRELVKRAG
jgi:DNA-binding response OmpR family regulator